MFVTVCLPECKDCGDRKVPCLECNPVKHFKALSGHIQVHKLSLEDYRRKYTQDGTGEDVSVGWTVANSQGHIRQNNANSQINNGVKQNDPLTQTRDYLSSTETDYYDDRFKILYRQADEDPALFSTVRDIVMGEINIFRIQEQQAKLTQRLGQGPKPKPDDISMIQQLGNLLKSTQDINLKALDKLNLTREKKQAAKKVIESTPSRYVSAYERIRKNFTKDQFERAMQEEQEAVGRLTAKQDSFYSLAPDKGVARTNVDTQDPDGISGFQ